MRLDGVEVKVSLGDRQTSAAVLALGLADVPPWQIFFVEDVTTGLLESTPLLDRQLIVRARQKTRGKDDVTVKFRPGRRSQLTAPWLEMTKTKDGDFDAELKVEGDWAGERRTLAISLTADRPDGLVAAAASTGDVSALLTEDQQRLIAECAEARFDLDVLTMLPPVSAMRWPAVGVIPAVRPGGAELKVRAERWTVHPLDFLELSIAVEVAVAQEAQQALEAFVVGKGLEPIAGEAKTSQVMKLLVARSAGAGL